MILYVILCSVTTNQCETKLYATEDRVSPTQCHMGMAPFVAQVAADKPGWRVRSFGCNNTATPQTNDANSAAAAGGVTTGSIGK